MDLRFIGDIERLIATNIYPLRIPIAIGLAVVAALVLRAAWRGRWDRAARRYPRRATAIVAAALVVGLPLTWYLASPLFISNRLVEAAPVPSAPAAGASGGRAATVATGSFSGADEFHFGRGRASIVETAPGRYSLRFEDFAVRNGPDLHVYLSPDAQGYADGVLELGTLKADQGAFNYDLPPGVDPAGFRSVVVWCKQFAVQFAVAPLAAG